MRGFLFRGPTHDTDSDWAFRSLYGRGRSRERARSRRHSARRFSIVANNIVPVDRDDRTSNTAGDAGKGAGVGAALGGGAGLLTGLGLMAIPGVGPVVAAGWLIATAVGAAAGAVAGGAVGGMIGALTASGVSEDDANVYAEGVRRGGTLVTAHVDDQRVSQAREILQRSRSGSGRAAECLSSGGLVAVRRSRPGLH